MIPLSLDQIATIVGGTLNEAADPHTVVNGTVEFDSRKVTPGGLFLCIPGARVDGHDFAAAAIADGAVAVIATRPVEVPAIMVQPLGKVDSRATALENDENGCTAAILQALAKLARYVVKTLIDEESLTVVGITGSSGKTTTKDLVTQVLSTAGAVVSPPGSFNNELGFPWTALRADRNTRFLVLEMSARGIGHIHDLTEIVAPTIGVVLNVGHAHLGEFGSQEAIAQAKGELVEALPAAAYGGIAILNADDDRVSQMSQRTKARVITFGTRPSADFTAVDIRMDRLSRASYTLSALGHEYPVQLAVSGEHNVLNSLAALIVAHACDIPLQQAITALSQATIVSGRRMDVKELSNSTIVINDSYNANPDSMRAAIAALSNMARTSTEMKRESWAILGLMGELGKESISQHVALAKTLADCGIDHVLTVGSNSEMNSLCDAAHEMGVSAVSIDNKEDAAAYLSEHYHPGDVILVKASQAVGLWTIADTIISAANGAAE